MSSDGPSISLIIITRNRKDELRSTLESVREQDTEFELVLVDNGSDDGTPDEVREFWPDAVFVCLDHNSGVSGGRNHGVDAASGEILAFLDDDATFDDVGALRSIRKRYRDDPDLGLLASNSFLTATGQPEEAAIPRRDKRVLDDDYESAYFCGVAFAVRRDVFESVGNFFEPYVYGCEELDLSYRALEKGFKILRAKDLVVHHRRSPLERPQGRWVYCNAKNRVWFAARMLPWRYVVSHGVVWWTYLLWIATTNGLLRDYLRGVTDGIRGLPEILQGRARLSNATIHSIKTRNGRLLC